MTLTYILTTYHLTVDTESGQRVFLRHSWLKLRLTEMRHSFHAASLKIKVSHQRNRITFTVVSLTAHSATHQLQT